MLDFLKYKVLEMFQSLWLLAVSASLLIDFFIIFISGGETTTPFATSKLVINTFLLLGLIYCIPILIISIAIGLWRGVVTYKDIENRIDFEESAGKRRWISRHNEVVLGIQLFCYKLVFYTTFISFIFWVLLY